MDKIRVVIIDDDQLVTVSLKTILEVSGQIEIVALGTDGMEAVGLYKDTAPDVMIMDIQMKQMGGIQATEELRKIDPGARVLLLTTFNDDEYIVGALRVGAKGYILKQDFAGIAPAVLAVAKGQTVFGEEVMDKIPILMKDNTEKESFIRELMNENELAIIRLVAKGFNNKEIAEKLYLSEGTVRNYLSTILEKLELRDRTQLAVFYLSNQ